MNGMMSILAMLISLAMMLTGAGEGADLSRTMTISDLTLTVNDESVTLNPTLSLGARSDGEMGLFDLALNLNGEKLFPVQLMADAEKLTAGLINANTAFFRARGGAGPTDADQHGHGERQPGAGPRNREAPAVPDPGAAAGLRGRD